MHDYEDFPLRRPAPSAPPAERARPSAVPPAPSFHSPEEARAYAKWEKERAFQTLLADETHACYAAHTRGQDAVNRALVVAALLVSATLVAGGGWLLVEAARWLWRRLHG